MTRAANLEAWADAGSWLIPRSEHHCGVLVYVPGGSFIVGPSPRVTNVMKQIAKAAKLALFMPRYRLAPEHICPAAIDDISKFLVGLLQQESKPETIVLAGEQAGPNLILAASHYDRSLDLSGFAAMVFYSPWLDLSLSSWSYLRNRLGVNYVHSREFTELAIRLYLGIEEPQITTKDPLASPLFGDFNKLPPVLMHGWESDISLDDAKQLLEKLERKYPDTQLHIWPRVSRMWERYELEYCQQSIEISASFIKKNLPV